MKYRFKRIVKPFIFSILWVHSYLFSWTRYLFSKRDSVDNIIYKLKMEKLNKFSETVAIVAIFQKKLCSNFHQVLSDLNKKNIPCFVFNNEHLDQQDILKILPLTTVYHECKYQAGKDFGCYQLGVKLINYLIEKEGLSFSRVVFINDSIMILPSRFPQFLEEFLSYTDDWVGITETTQIHYHVSSWFFSVSKRIWGEVAFQKFWESYKPLSPRRYVIRKGEVLLSQTLIRIGYAPRVMFASSRFFSALMQQRPEQWLDFIRFLPIAVMSELFPEHIQLSLINSGKLIVDYIYSKLLSSQSDTNLTHFWQCLGILHADFVFVKKDIYYRGVYSLSQIREVASRLPEFEQLVEKIIAKPDPRTFSLYKRAQHTFHFI